MLVLKASTWAKYKGIMFKMVYNAGLNLSDNARLIWCRVLEKMDLEARHEI